jgi:predicted DNA-binding transcriptional regulator AlpA
MKFLSDRDLAARYSIGRTTVWRWLADGRLPAPVQLTPGTTRWRLIDIEEFESKRLAASTAAAQEGAAADRA